MKCVVNLGGLAVGIVAIIFGSQNLNHPCSQSDDLIDLGLWMVIHGALMTFFSVGTGFALFLGNSGETVHNCGQAVYATFNLVWSIIGAVILWRDSRACEAEDKQFYDAAMAVVIISLIFVCCGFISSSKKSEES